MNYATARASLISQPKKWLITGVAGFIGSNLLETLLKLNQDVIGLDNFSTGHAKNLAEIETLVTPEQWARFDFLEGDIRDVATCAQATRNVDYVLHQAALGSVPRSLADPLTSNASNIDGFLNMLVAARDNEVRNFVYAASSSTYGDHSALPKNEDTIGKPLSPYAVTKLVNELYADVFSKNYGFSSIGLRYFNVFGARQDPEGAYAAVIPKWIAAMIKKQPVRINGDGESSRDFCYIDNAVQANILAAHSPNESRNQIYNIAVGERTTLNELFEMLRGALASHNIHYDSPPEYCDFRPGDVRHSQANIDKAKNLLGYSPTHDIYQGIIAAMPWYLSSHRD